MYSVSELSEVLEAEISGEGMAHVVISGISTDSRSVRAGDCFFAIRGENFDGHDYVGAAFEAGAVCAVVSRNVTAAGFVLKVHDTVEALGRLAADYRLRLKWKVVAITGSVGKTTTRRMIAHVLATKFRVRQSPKNFNNEIGLPLSILAGEAEDEILVAELGANHRGEIAHLSRIARPNVAIVTNVQPAHLEGFGSLEAIVEEKLSIADGLMEHGVLLTNADQPILAEHAQRRGRPFKTFGANAAATYRTGGIEVDAFCSRLRIEAVTVRVPLAGRGNAANALVAWAVCCQFGISAEDFASAMESMPAADMRTEIVPLGGSLIIDDCYNANPASMKNAIEILSNIAGSRQGRTVFICGDMAELGEESQSLHRDLAKDVVDAGVDVLITVGALARIVADTASARAGGAIRTESFDDTGSLCDNLHELLEDTDIILVKGSRTNRLEQAVEKLKELFASSAAGDAGRDARKVK
jgi:UDP-N-acetylmuramoyl-tripeptide--D-alanyl-D-alanine ligase